MKKINKYLAQDNTEFKEERDCLLYEKNLETIDSIVGLSNECGLDIRMAEINSLRNILLKLTQVKHILVLEKITC